MTPPHRADPLVVALDDDHFGATVDGRPVALHRLRNRAGWQAAFVGHGARLVQLLVPDRDGVLGDVVLGYDHIGAVLAGHASMGAFIGRHAGRIAGARFVLDGTPHALPADESGHCLHGGPRGSRFRVFDVQPLAPEAVEMRLVMDDDGFPGALALRLVCRLDDDALALEWQATAQGQPTVASFTGHAFFNLSGDPRRPVDDHLLQIAADRFLPLGPTLVPTGEQRPVAGTPMDFRTTPKPVGRDLGLDDEQLRIAGGYDHCFVIDRPAAQADRDDALALAARVEHPASGRVLEVWTTEPCLQLYAGQHLGAGTPRDIGKGGLRFARRGGLCLEPSRFPDAPNQPSFPSAVLRPGQTRRGRIVYRFPTGG